MKNHVIGDGDKRITCPDRYLVDSESDTITLIWDPAHVDIPIRVTVITVAPKNPNENEAVFWSLIEKARKKNVQPKVVENKAVYTYHKPAAEDGYVLYFFEVGMGNHLSIFSITVSTAQENSEAFNKVRTDLETMIESLVERGREEQFDCSLQECEKDQIRRAAELLLRPDSDDRNWSHLQQHYDQAYHSDDRQLAAQIGLAFGELIRLEIPSFQWSVKIDNDGRSKSLDFGDSNICIFPVDMILKRIERKELIDFQALLSGTIEAVEDLYRKYQEQL